MVAPTNARLRCPRMEPRTRTVTVSPAVASLRTELTYGRDQAICMRQADVPDVRGAMPFAESRPGDPGDEREKPRTHSDPSPIRYGNPEVPPGEKK